MGKLTALYRAHPTILNAVLANVIGLAVALGVDLSATLEASILGLANTIAFILTWNQVTPVIDGEAKVVNSAGQVLKIGDMLGGVAVRAEVIEED